mmetsp:Transcript_1966/g.4387  ORF Transcript_1966/g.4387 Transcript_1966/m.4387 type:complete len:761 (+) Transcript_1966:23-2305(+)
MLNTPSTGQVKKTPRTPADSACIIAIIENRAREVGLAKLELNSYEITLSQFADNSTYINTISTLHAWDPVEILVCRAAQSSALMVRIAEQLQGVTVTAIARKFFNEGRGVELYRGACVTDLNSDTEQKYVCMAALSALHKYIEYSQSIYLYSESLKVSFKHLDSILVLDWKTMQALEIVLSQEGSHKESLSSLFPCKTDAGRRLVRAALLQPCTDQPTLQRRYEALDELTENQCLRSELLTCISHFSNTELITARLVQKGKDSAKLMQAQVAIFQPMKQALKCAAALFNLLKVHSPKSSLLKAFQEALRDQRIPALLRELDDVLDDQAKSQSSHLATLNLIKPRVNALLDGKEHTVSKEVANRLIEDIQEAACDVKIKLSEPSLKLTYSASRGYHLEMPVSLLTRTSVQASSFVQVHKKAKKAFASTESLVSLNTQLQATLDEVSSLSYSVLAGLLDLARERISCLYNITYVVASLDMLLAFAVYSSTFPSVKPEFTGRFLMKGARNPIIEGIKKKALVANDLEMNEVSRVHILTGPNASGKSTFLVTIGQLIVLAHAGCFVPATCAHFPKLKNLFLRAGEAESLEEGNSGFMSEMKEMTHMLANARPESLILIDEMCRGTFSEDANSIAWTLCEAFLIKGSFTVLATHLQSLTSLESLYLPIRNFHTIDYKVKAGTCPKNHGYGLALAGQTALPEVILAEAAIVLQTIAQKNIRPRADLQRHKKVCDVAQELLALTSSSLDESALRKHLKELKVLYLTP